MIKATEANRVALSTIRVKKLERILTVVYEAKTSSAKGEERR